MNGVSVFESQPRQLQIFLVEISVELHTVVKAIPSSPSPLFFPSAFLNLSPLLVLATTFVMTTIYLRITAQAVAVVPNATRITPSGAFGTGPSNLLPPQKNPPHPSCKAYRITISPPA
ncbi:hypothetical protein R3P38DRAFT_3229456 [Favolaschia claudopus]|uniref:Uncharacterized protein n=1 Tax=Favolaschia claudopus TaxID=2862362 RepID=A0AAV9ZPZ5_9AGAR